MSPFTVSKPVTNREIWKAVAPRDTDCPKTGSAVRERFFWGRRD